MDSIENDPRFAHIATDPRFRPMPKSKRKVKIDSRFQSLFTNTHFSHRTDIDKRGRPILDSSKKNKHVMEKFYELSDNSDSEKDEADNDEASKEPAPKKLKKDTRGRVVSPKKDAKTESDDKPEESESATSSESEDDDTELPEFTQEFALEETEIDHKWNELHTDAPAISESTRRLAVCNMDWDYVKAQDLFILFKSFVPEGGQVKSVTIYPSEFGKERMSEEALLGPREIREGVKEEDVRDDEVKGRKKNKKQVKDQKKIKQTEKEREAAQTEKLREYQLNRLRYYFAVVDCDSVGTADMIYSECDGREYQLSSVRLDLRFIPDDMTFDDEPKESFSEEQSIVGYQPSQFNSTALSQAKVEVTWDETEFDRLARRIGSLQPKELESIVEENKFAEIIAPPESDSEDEQDGRPAWLQNILSDEKKAFTEEEKIQLYRKVLMDQLVEDQDEKKAEEGEVDQEVEWQVGLKTSVEKKLKKKELQGENTIVSDFLEKKKAKKKKKRVEKMKKLEVKEDGDSEAFSDDEIPGGIESFKDMFQEEPDLNIHAKGKKKKQKLNKRKGDKDDDSVDEKLKAELELIVMDEEGDKKISKPEVVKEKSKKKKKKLAKMKKSAEEDYNLDLNDPRFSALYNSHLFHIDPTAPQFKKTKNMLKLVDEQIKRKKDAQPKTTNAAVKNKSQALVERLKSKIKK
ncbi:unnamed protein product [Lymnaea stagnalis]|uniref:NUC153 domain-containing protein n=1 Tax=Lymnaea stagnalis TaxID=6523 RepID=A0AAV2HRT7_LYMST